MKNLVKPAFLIIALGISASAHAAEDKKLTIEDLQARITYLETALDGAIQQRNAAQAQLSNMALEAATKNAIEQRAKEKTK